MERPVYLILENGKVFEGIAFGADRNVTGEIVFTTGMTGYLETLTDPAYYGQIVVQTFPLIGNYGMIPEDLESSRIHACAYVVRELCDTPSNFRMEGILEDFLKAQGIPGIRGIDTRELTRIIREHGVMNARLTQDAAELPSAAEAVKSYCIANAVAAVTPKEAASYPAEEEKFKVVLWDFGAKQGMIRQLNQRGCSVTCAPAGTTAAEIVALKPDGVLLSGGPGDPAENTAIVAEVKQLCEAGIPLFAYGLGHQLLALAQGARTEKLKYGHRGANQPVKYWKNGRVYITGQNHGYAVVADSLPAGAEQVFTNANDGSCEGVVYASIPAIAVQFYPESCSSPMDGTFLFDEFLAMMGRK